MMKKQRLRKSFCAISWILAVALTVSPLAAQNPQEPSSTAADGDTTAKTFPNVEKDSTPLAASSAPAPQPRTEDELSPPGKSKWVILAAIVVTGAVIAAILLL